MAIRVTQVPVEAAITPDEAALRVTQVPVEVAVTPDEAALRVTQVPVEAAITPNEADLRVSQIVVEVLVFSYISGSLSQTLEDVTLDGESEFSNLIEGSLSQTLQDVTVQARGNLYTEKFFFCRCRRIRALGIGKRRI